MAYRDYSERQDGETQRQFDNRMMSRRELDRLNKQGYSGRSNDNTPTPLVDFFFEQLSIEHADLSPKALKFSRICFLTFCAGGMFYFSGLSFPEIFGMELPKLIMCISGGILAVIYLSTIAMVLALGFSLFSGSFLSGIMFLGIAVGIYFAKRYFLNAKQKEPIQQDTYYYDDDSEYV